MGGFLNVTDRTRLSPRIAVGADDRIWAVHTACPRVDRGLGC